MILRLKISRNDDKKDRKKHLRRKLLRQIRYGSIRALLALIMQTAMFAKCRHNADSIRSIHPETFHFDFNVYFNVNFNVNFNVDHVCQMINFQNIFFFFEIRRYSKKKIILLFRF